MTKLRSRVLVALVTLASLLAVFWYLFIGTVSDELSPEEISDMSQNKKSQVLVKRVELPQHAIVSPYLNKLTLQLENWDLQGDIVVQTGQYISLTTSRKHQAGSMFLRNPVNAQSFEMELTFHIHGDGTIQADGLVLWFVEELSIGDLFGARNNFRGLAIVVDTFRNGQDGTFPLVSAHHGETPVFFEKHNDGKSTRRASCTVKLLMNPALGKTRMRVVHTRNGYLSVDLNHDPDHAGDWHNCFTLLDVKLPLQFYLGLSAETGELYENVDIIESKIFALYAQDTDRYLDSLDELVVQHQTPAQAPEDLHVKKRTRKLILRLHKSEQRIKERESQHRLEKYGDPDATFIRRTAAKIKACAKYAVYFFGAAFVFWIIRILVKSKRGRRLFKSSGLLD